MPWWITGSEDGEECDEPSLETLWNDVKCRARSEKGLPRSGYAGRAAGFIGSVVGWLRRRLNG